MIFIHFFWQFCSQFFLFKIAMFFSDFLLQKLYCSIQVFETLASTFWSKHIFAKKSLFFYCMKKRLRRMWMQYTSRCPSGQFSTPKHSFFLLTQLINTEFVVWSFWQLWILFFTFKKVKIPFFIFFLGQHWAVFYVLAPARLGLLCSYLSYSAWGGNSGAPPWAVVYRPM